MTRHWYAAETTCKFTLLGKVPSTPILHIFPDPWARDTWVSHSTSDFHQPGYRYPLYSSHALAQRYRRLLNQHVPQPIPHSQLHYHERTINHDNP